MTQISKWWCLCLVAMLAFTTTSFAQEDKTNDDEPVVVYDPDDIGGDKRFNLNKLVIGGNGNFFIANAIFFELSPFVAYRLTDRWLVGTGINFSHIAANDVGIGFLYVDDYGNEFRDVIGFDRYSENFIGGRLLTRYLLFHVGDPQGVFATAEFQYNGKNVRVDGDRVPKDRMYDFDGFPVELQVDNRAVPSMLAGLGYSTNFYGQFGATFELMYDFLWKQDVSFNEFPYTYRVGFTYGF